METLDTSEAYNALKDFLISETESLNKKTKTTFIIGVIFIAVIISYMSFILWMVSTLLEPQNAAIMITQQVDANLPKFYLEAERALSLKAPVLANQMSEVFLNTIPELRKSAENQIELTFKEIVPYVSRQFEDMITDYIILNADSLRALAEESTIDEFIDHLTNVLITQFSESMGREIESQYGNRNLVYFRENSLLTLETMNTHLENLLHADISTMDRRHQLQRRILADITQKLISSTN